MRASPGAITVRWDPLEHPRGRLGRFVEVLGNLQRAGDRAELGGGVSVERQRDGRLRVRGRGGRVVSARSERAAATAALTERAGDIAGSDPEDFPSRTWLNARGAMDEVDAVEVDRQADEHLAFHDDLERSRLERELSDAIAATSGPVPPSPRGPSMASPPVITDASSRETARINVRLKEAQREYYDAKDDVARWAARVGQPGQERNLATARLRLDAATDAIGAVLAVSKTYAYRRARAA